jgi:hypothetical protein
MKEWMRERLFGFLLPLIREQAGEREAKMLTRMDEIAEGSRLNTAVLSERIEAQGRRIDGEIREQIGSSEARVNGRIDKVGTDMAAADEGLSRRIDAQCGSVNDILKSISALSEMVTCLGGRVAVQGERISSILESDTMRLVRLCHGILDGDIGQAAEFGIHKVLISDIYPTDTAKTNAAQEMAKQYLVEKYGTAEKDWKINLAVQLKYAQVRGRI